MAKVIGIDLGTTNSVVAVMQGKDVEVIVNEEGARTTPSVVGWDEKGEVLVGQVAKRQSITNPEHTVYSAKRFMGRKEPEVQEEARRVPYKVTKSPNGDAAFMIRGKVVAPPEVSAHVLRKLKQAAEAYLGETVSDAVITVPAYFNDTQRQATKDAGKIAGLNVRRIINEPTAAALAYGLDKKKDETIAVFDLGGGTFDISILEVSENLVEVKSTNGDTHLGGDDVDQRVMDHLIDEFKKDNGIDLAKDKMALQRVRDAAEKAKIELSATQETVVNLPYVAMANNAPLHMNIKLTRAKLEQMLEPLVKRAFDACERAMKDANKKPVDIHEVVLVGGSTRIPMVQKKVKEFFGREPNRSVNPDEVVAIGAAVQGAILTGEVKDMLLLDVCPLSLGVETKGGISTPLIPRNTTIPTSKSEVFSTASDNQTTVEVHVLQGERPMARDNKSLGRFSLEGIPGAPQGVPKIRVTFDIDANGILQVTAKDEVSGRNNKITITSGSGLPKEEVERLVREAQSHESEDKRLRDEAENRNKAEAMAYQVEKTLRDYKDKIQASDATVLEAALKDTRDAVASGDNDRVKSATEKLEKESHRIATLLYQSSGGPGEEGAPAEAPPPAAKDDGVIDAEFEENK